MIIILGILIPILIYLEIGSRKQYTYIDIGYYVTDDGVKKELLPYRNYKMGYESDDFEIGSLISYSEYIIFKNKNITEIVLPKGYYGIKYFGGKLKKLTVSDDLMLIACPNNQLEKLNAPPNISWINIAGNPIKKIRPSNKKRNLSAKPRLILDFFALINPYKHPKFDIEYR